MRSLYFTIPFILILSCAKPLEPRTASPENAPLETPEEIGRIGLSLKNKYESGSELFNFFFWPSNLDREKLKELSTNVSEIGIEIEDRYKIVDEINFRKSKIDKKIQILEEERDLKLADLYKKYGCIKDNCKEIESPDEVIPESCDQLAGTPWNSEQLKNECLEKEGKINSETEEASLVLEHEVSDLETEIDNHLEYITSRADAITSLLENNNEKSEEWMNWMQTKEANIVIENQTPQISLKIMFNNNLGGVGNRYLFYKSKDSADIKEIKYYSENQIPVLEFVMFEKRATRVNGQNGEERTGIFYKIKLRQTELDYGLEYLGDVERFDASGNSFGKGLMKIYIKPKY
ncbi:MAG: hypothetical protein ACHQYQ_05690 [Bacteriovoracales bacterium]